VVPKPVDARVRAEVARRAQFRCEYCLIHQDDAGFSHEVDHIISRKHGGASVKTNLAYCCVACNRFKGTDVASVDLASGELVRLFHPRKDDWSQHFELDGARIKPRTLCGDTTVRLLKFNLDERVAERRLLQDLNRYPR